MILVRVAKSISLLLLALNHVIRTKLAAVRNDDVLIGLVALVRGRVLDRSDGRSTRYDFAEDDVLAVEVRRRQCRLAPSDAT